MNRDLSSIGLWNRDIASDIKKLLAINMTGKELTNDQLVQAYVLLYPFIASEFVHRSDLISWEQQIRKEFDAEIEKLNNQIAAYNKQLITAIKTITPSTPGATAMIPMDAAVNPSLKSWSSKPNDFKFGEQIITDSSNYTKSAYHRNPNIDPDNYSPKIVVSVAFKEAYKIIPFDAYRDNINTGDQDFIQNGL